MQSSLLLTLLAVSAAGSVASLSVDCGPREVAVFSTLEISISDNDGRISPTFNSNNVVRGQVASSSGEKQPTTVLGFYFQDYTPISSGGGGEAQQPIGDGVFKLRFTPTKTTTSSSPMKISLFINGTQLPQVCSYDVVAAKNISKETGFVRIGKNREHFVVDSGSTSKPLFLIGENLAWTDSKGISTFEEYFRNLSSNGANYVRVWLTDGWDDLFLETSLGNYSLPNAWHVDRLLSLAESFNVRLLMCIESFNLFCNAPSPMPCFWESSVYNSKNGGPLGKDGGEFFVNERAKELFKQRLEYIVARYAHSPSVLAWEFFNEVDLTDNFDPQAQRQWLEEMKFFLNSIDPYHHPISTSFSVGNNAVALSDILDFAMIHTYGSKNANDQGDNTRYWAGRLVSTFTKPGFVAETGETDADKSGLDDPSGLGLRNSFWASVASASAGTAMTWWWDTWIAKYSLYSSFDAVRRVTETIAFDQYQWSPLKADAPTCSDVSPNVYTCEQQANSCDKVWMGDYCCKTCSKCSSRCVGSAPVIAWIPLEIPQVRALASVGRLIDTETSSSVSIGIYWVQNANNTYTAQNVSKPASERAQVRRIEDGEVFVPLATSSSSSSSSVSPLLSSDVKCFNVQWFDTTNGQVVTSAKVAASSGIHSIKVPAFVGDLFGVVRGEKEAC